MGIGSGIFQLTDDEIDIGRLPKCPGDMFAQLMGQWLRK